MSSIIENFSKKTSYSKTNKLIFWVAIAVFCILFYNQNLGFNLFLFACFTLTSVFVLDKRPFADPHAKLIAFLLLLVTASASWFSDFFSSFYSIVLFFLLAFSLFDLDKKLIFFPIKAFSNFILLPFHLYKTNPFGFSEKSSFTIKKFIYYLGFPLVIIIIFIALYCIINAEFQSIFKSISLDFINIQFLVTFFIGGIFMTYFWLYNNALRLDNELIRPYTTENFTSGSIQNFKEKFNQMQYNSGLILFSVLNCTLLLLLFTDFSQISNQNSFLKNLSFSDYVHEGVTAVIFSILLAISLILFYFKGNLNFTSNKLLKNLVFLWIGLNVLLLISTFIKNLIYIENYGLTLKRLGVIAFLSLAFIGLIISFIKVMKSKANYFIFNKMLWVFVVFFAGICPINWSSIVTKHNISEYKKGNIDLDINYLYTLPDYNYVVLKEFKKEEKSIQTSKKILEVNYYGTVDPSKIMSQRRNAIFSYYNENIDYRSTAFFYDWVSCSIEKDTK